MIKDLSILKEAKNLLEFEMDERSITEVEVTEVEELIQVKTQGNMLDRFLQLKKLVTKECATHNKEIEKLIKKYSKKIIPTNDFLALENNDLVDYTSEIGENENGEEVDVTFLNGKTMVVYVKGRKK